MEVTVLIVGSGPAGLATAACLEQRRIPYVIVERESCSASLWHHRAYDRLKLHLAKEFCELPHMAYPTSTPTHVPRERFVEHLESYMDCFGICPRYCTVVESASYNESRRHWVVLTWNVDMGAKVRITTCFLVVATGENSAASILLFPGFARFTREIIHSSAYKSGKGHVGKRVLVVGAGNSGMEIAYDLATHGAHTSIVIRSPVHIMTKELIRFGMTLAQKLPVTIVDVVLVMVANFIFGDMSKHGIRRPKMGPLFLKSQTGRSPVIDVGTAKLIKEGAIMVFKGISRIDVNNVEFHGGKKLPFDAINGESMFTADGFPTRDFPNHWKGENGLYCAGFARRGLAGISMDAKNIADDITAALNN
ncbi:hypothetical protein ABZP36_009449 [Zizania latifolia]